MFVVVSVCLSLLLFAYCIYSVMSALLEQLNDAASGGGPLHNYDIGGPLGGPPGTHVLGAPTKGALLMGGPHEGTLFGGLPLEGAPHEGALFGGPLLEGPPPKEGAFFGGAPQGVLFGGGPQGAIVGGAPQGAPVRRLQNVVSIGPPDGYTGFDPQNMWEAFKGAPQDYLLFLCFLLHAFLAGCFCSWLCTQRSYQKAVVVSP